MNYEMLIKTLIEKHNTSQSALARQMGVSPGFINQLATGRRKPGRDTLKKIADILGEPVSIFYSEDISTDKSLVKNKLSKEEQEYVDKLVEIFRTKQQKTIIAIKQNIDAFLDNPNRVTVSARPAQKKSAVG